MVVKCSLLNFMTLIVSQIEDSSASSLYYAAYDIRFIASDLLASFYSRHMHVKQHSV